jgi:predicted permease
MGQDIRFGIKMLLKHRAFTAAAVVTLALCIGANTAIFSVLQAVVLRGLPFDEAEQLVQIYNVYPGVGVSDRGANSVPDYFDRRKLTDVFSEVALLGLGGWDVGLGASVQRVNGASVTPSYFNVLRGRPILGRTFSEEEGIKGKDRVAILSEGLWADLFARDPNILGKDIRMSGIEYRIVGVMPGSFAMPGSEIRVWLPLTFTPEQMSDDGRHSNNWGMIARLQPGVSRERAQARIDALNREIIERFPKYRTLIENARYATRVLSLKDELIKEVRPLLYLLQIAVAVVLLIGCVNLANLMLVRSNVRMKELAIRFSMGAGRWRIGRQLLTESVLLALAGGALGILVGYAGIRGLARLGATDLPRGTSIGIDAGVLAFTVAVAVATGIAFGAAPLFHVLRRDLNDVFRGNERSGTAGRHALWVRSALVVCQFALAFVLLIGSGLLTLSFARLLDVRTGFDAQDVVTARVNLPRIRYPEDAQARTFMSGVLERVRAIPGVKHASATTYLPFSRTINASSILIVGRPLGPGEIPPVPGWNVVDPSYFAAMSIPVLQGRTFADGDGPESPRVAVIDEFLAKKYWPQGGAVGATIQRRIDNPKDTCTIVGVVSSVKTGDLTEQNPVGQVYFHFRQYMPRTMHLVVKTNRDDAQVIPAIRHEVQQADPELALFDVRTMPQRIAASLVNRRAAMVLCLIFAGLALLLASVGIYGVLAYGVSERTRELGIRVALGASSRDIVGMVVGSGLWLSALGLAAGAVAANALTRLMETMLFGVRPSDPVVFASVAALLALVAVLASLIPSLRALRIRPATALRYE